MTNEKHIWFSRQGSQRDDLWDYCGIGSNGYGTVFILADGATSGPSGGDLAQSIVVEVVNRFSKGTSKQKAFQIDAFLGPIHIHLRKKFKLDFASYIIVLSYPNKPLQIYFAGDCRYGVLKENTKLEWLTHPHCLANSIATLDTEALRETPSRHILTRSFGYKRYGPPEYLEHSPHGSEKVIIATDGFWADLCPGKARDLLLHGTISKSKFLDDCSFLLLDPGAGLARLNQSDLLSNSSNIFLG